jgi:hypothetical protein
MPLTNDHHGYTHHEKPSPWQQNVGVKEWRKFLDTERKMQSASSHLHPLLFLIYLPKVQSTSQDQKYVMFM